MAVLALGAAFAGVAGTARSDTPAPKQVLANMRQLPPANVQLANFNGQWRLGFDSQVTNDGPGYLKITGNGLGDGTMVAEQDVQMSDGTETVIPGIGEMQYVIGGGHQHWHLLDFERYELRSADDPSTPIVRDQKTGFCLAASFTADFCGKNQPDLTTVTEGLVDGASDTYLGYLEGQYLVIDPTTVPAGDYLLDNRVNPNGALLETTQGDNAATVRLTITWSDSGTPSMTITNTCFASIDCPPPPPPSPAPDPQPQPQPQPDAQPADPGHATDTAVVQPQPVPVVPAASWGPTPELATMSREMAGRLVRRAIAKATRHAPEKLRTTCKRRALDTFACSSTWHTRARVRWSGRVRVWYRLREGELSWYYNLSATRHPGGDSIVTRAALGSVARVIYSGPTGSLLRPLGD
jgi:hypothetical protein